MVPSRPVEPRLRLSKRVTNGNVLLILVTAFLVAQRMVRTELHSITISNFEELFKASTVDNPSFDQETSLIRKQQHTSAANARNLEPTATKKPAQQREAPSTHRAQDLPGASSTHIGAAGANEASLSDALQRENVPSAEHDPAVSAIYKELLHVHSVLPFRDYAQSSPFQHPFAGALDQDEHWGYVHDPKVLLNAPLSTNVTEAGDVHEVCAPSASQRNGTKDWLSSDGHKVLQKIKIANPQGPPNGASPRILCAVHAKDGDAANVQAIAETWGARCDGFLAASTYTDPATATVHIPHFGKEGDSGSSWQKLRSMLVYLFVNFRDDYDYFHVCGDDTYLIVDNLRAFLESPKVDSANSNHEPLQLGGPIKPFWKTTLAEEGFSYNGAGPGYTLNRAALNLFVNTSLAECHANDDVGNEDMIMGLCLHDLLGADGYRERLQTMDEQGAARYHHADPNNLIEDRSKKGPLKGFLNQQRAWQREEFGGPKDSYKAISNSSIAFHLIKDPNYMRRVDAILYPRGSMGSYCASQSIVPEPKKELDLQQGNMALDVQSTTAPNNGEDPIFVELEKAEALLEEVIKEKEGVADPDNGWEPRAVQEENQADEPLSQTEATSTSAVAEVQVEELSNNNEASLKNDAEDYQFLKEAEVVVPEEKPVIVVPDQTVATSTENSATAETQVEEPTPKAESQSTSNIEGHEEVTAESSIFLKEPAAVVQQNSDKYTIQAEMEVQEKELAYQSAESQPTPEHQDILFSKQENDRSAKKSASGKVHLEEQNANSDPHLASKDGNHGEDSSSEDMLPNLAQLPSSATDERRKVEEIKKENDSSQQEGGRQPRAALISKRNRASSTGRAVTAKTPVEALVSNKETSPTSKDAQSKEDDSVSKIFQKLAKATNAGTGKRTKALLEAMMKNNEKVAHPEVGAPKKPQDAQNSKPKRVGSAEQYTTKDKRSPADAEENDTMTEIPVNPAEDSSPETGLVEQEEGAKEKQKSSKPDARKETASVLKRSQGMLLSRKNGMAALADKLDANAESQTASNHGGVNPIAKPLPNLARTASPVTAKTEKALHAKMVKQKEKTPYPEVGKLKKRRGTVLSKPKEASPVLRGATAKTGAEEQKQAQSVSTSDAPTQDESIIREQFLKLANAAGPEVGQKYKALLEEAMEKTANAEVREDNERAINTRKQGLLERPTHALTDKRATKKTGSTEVQRRAALRYKLKGTRSEMLVQEPNAEMLGN